MVGLVVWIFFSQSVLSAAPSLLEQGALVRKARFPRETIPGAVVSVQLVTFLVILALLAIVTIAIRGTLDVALLLLPLILACLYAFTLGFALAVSILHAYFRDVAPILSAALLPWFFVSPIFFRIDSITVAGGVPQPARVGQPGRAVHHRDPRRDLRRRRARDATCWPTSRWPRS